MTKAYNVSITEELRYIIEVEANSPEEAETKAFESLDFANNNFKDNDSKVTAIEEVEEN